MKLGRHNIRPNHLHIMVSAPGFRRLVTAMYPEGDTYLNSDAVFGVKKSLVVVRNCSHQMRCGDLNSVFFLI